MLNTPYTLFNFCVVVHSSIMWESCSHAWYPRLFITYSHPSLKQGSLHLGKKKTSGQTTFPSFVLQLVSTLSRFASFMFLFLLFWTYVITYWHKKNGSSFFFFIFCCLMLYEVLFLENLKWPCYCIHLFVIYRDFFSKKYGVCG